jgi:dihydropyrimidine dehydrogenase (NAD+) subunit PreT
MELQKSGYQGHGFKRCNLCSGVFENARESRERRRDGRREAIIIGGGDVAMDCAATAKLLGANPVTIVYRRTLEEAPAISTSWNTFNPWESHIITKFKPQEIVGENGSVAGLIAEGTDEFSQLKLKAKHIIFAIGQEAEDMKKIAPVELNDNGTIACDVNKGFTNIDGIFAAGDIVNGGKTINEAVAARKIRCGKHHQVPDKERRCQLAWQKKQIYRSNI